MRWSNILNEQTVNWLSIYGYVCVLKKDLIIEIIVKLLFLML